MGGLACIYMIWLGLHNQSAHAPSKNLAIKATWGGAIDNSYVCIASDLASSTESEV